MQEGNSPANQLFQEIEVEVFGYHICCKGHSGIRFYTAFFYIHTHTQTHAQCLVISLVVRVTVAFVFIPHSSAHTKFGYFTCCKGQSGISFYTTFFYTHNDYKLTETLSISCKIIIVSYGKIMLLQNCEQNQQYINVPFVLVP